jgi:hypothetical protein
MLLTVVKSLLICQLIEILLVPINKFSSQQNLMLMSTLDFNVTALSHFLSNLSFHVTGSSHFLLMLMSSLLFYVTAP